MITIVLLVLMTVLGVHSISIIERSRMLQQQEEELLVQIRYQERRAAEIEEFEAFAHTDEHVRIMAEEVLGLVEPDVIIFRPID
ncbi:MAG: septum formation initiator family protein [Lachnospiraceae bacterium]|nr:septum formation initiator family protein [Lachnospiraceae bacterium]